MEGKILCNSTPNHSTPAYELLVTPRVTKPKVAETPAKKLDFDFEPEVGNQGAAKSKTGVQEPPGPDPTALGPIEPELGPTWPSSPGLEELDAFQSTSSVQQHTRQEVMKKWQSANQRPSPL